MNDSSLFFFPNKYRIVLFYRQITVESRRFDSMEIIEILRNHLDKDQLAFSGRAQLLEILNNVETQLNKDHHFAVAEIRFDNHVACCIDLEG